MNILKLEEGGYEAAMFGLSTSFMEEGIDFWEWWSADKFDQMERLAVKQANKDGGHNKFLEHIMTWFVIRAPRGFWQEYDTYRLETKQSASTMHTIQRRPLTKDDFEPGTDQRMIDIFNNILLDVTEGFQFTRRLSGDKLQRIKWALPEGFLQTRECRISYKTLRNMILQRRTHRLAQWQYFIEEVLQQVNNPELLPNLDE